MATSICCASVAKYVSVLMENECWGRQQTGSTGPRTELWSWALTFSSSVKRLRVFSALQLFVSANTFCQRSDCQLLVLQHVQKNQKCFGFCVVFIIFSVFSIHGLHFEERDYSVHLRRQCGGPKNAEWIFKPGFKKFLIGLSVLMRWSWLIKGCN